jgi:hypothetical protein
MTSLVSRDDIESEIWKLSGRTAPWHIEKLMRLIDRYAIENARKWAAQYPQEPEPQDDGWPDLGLGDSDLAFEVTRCTACGRVKRWPQFYRDKTRSTGRRNRCMKCCKTGKGDEEYPTITFTCHACGKTRKASDFYKNAGTKTGFDNRCKTCKDGSKQAKIFKCKMCQREKPQYAFPPGKLKEPHANYACLECWPEGTKLLPKKGYKCRECSQFKPVNEFPPGKKDKPGSVQYCNDCESRYLHDKDYRSSRRTA